MPPGPEAAPSTISSPPAPADVLRWISEAGPQLWFPSEPSARHGTNRDALDEPLWQLRQAGLIEVGDWVKGRGQGFTVTAVGRETLADPKRLGEALRPPNSATPETIAAAEPEWARRLTPFERGEMARRAVYEPRSPVVTPILLAANLAWFLAALVLAWWSEVPLRRFLESGNSEIMIRTGAADGFHLAAGQWWRLLSCCFVHFGVGHLLMNMIALAITGPLAESMWGRWRFATIYLVGGVAGSCAGMAVHPGSLLAGASGAVWAVMTAALLWVVRYRKHLPKDDEDAGVSELTRRLVLLLVVNLAASFIPGVSWPAHFGGGLAGALAALALDFTRPGSDRSRVAGWVAFALVAAAGPLGLLVAMNTTHDWQVIRTVTANRQVFDRIADLASARAAFERSLRASGWDGLNATHQEVKVALVTQVPGAVRSARRRLGELRTTAAQARELAKPEAAAYLDAVAAYAAEADRLLSAGRTPSADENAALMDRFRAAERAWAAIGNRP